MNIGDKVLGCTSLMWFPSGVLHEVEVTALAADRFRGRAVKRRLGFLWRVYREFWFGENDNRGVITEKTGVSE